MAHGYKAVGWTPFKVLFDRWMLAGVFAYLVIFILVTVLAQPPGQSLAELQIVIRATGTLAFLLLTFILCIGPLARLSDRFKPFLCNRRHLGVTTAIIATIHGAVVILWYHGFGEISPLVSVFASNPRYDSIAGFPFESLGFAVLIILVLMAATSHDFWNTNLGPGLWKGLHMMVYIAYALLVAHVALGAIQYEKSALYVALVALGAGTVSVLHLATALFDSGGQRTEATDGWLKAGEAMAIPDNRALILTPETGERIAVYRYGNKVSAISNVCRHQGGPLGEGRIIDGCVTCPWHGFQYDPSTGRSPPPFTERIATYNTRIENGQVLVDPDPNPPGTFVEPSVIGPAGPAATTPPNPASGQEQPA